jgi:shikimate kinase
LGGSCYGQGVNLVLMGLRGSGKSTVGRLVAARRGAAFVDLDDVTPRLLGYASAGEAWRASGEAGFREAETRALTQTLAADGRVIALGGGTPMAPGCRAMLQDAAAAGRARLVYLRADAGVLRRRLQQADNSHRPSLTGIGVLDEIETVFAARDPLYREIAEHIIEVGGLAIEEVVERVAALASPWKADGGVGL